MLGRKKNYWSEPEDIVDHDPISQREREMQKIIEIFNSGRITRISDSNSNGVVAIRMDSDVVMKINNVLKEYKGAHFRTGIAYVTYYVGGNNSSLVDYLDNNNLGIVSSKLSVMTETNEIEKFMAYTSIIQYPVCIKSVPIVMTASTQIGMSVEIDLEPTGSNYGPKVKKLLDEYIQKTLRDVVMTFRGIDVSMGEHIGFENNEFSGYSKISTIRTTSMFGTNADERYIPMVKRKMTDDVFSVVKEYDPVNIKNLNMKEVKDNGEGIYPAEEQDG